MFCLCFVDMSSVFCIIFRFFRLMLIANWDIVQQLAKLGYVCGMQCIK